MKYIQIKKESESKLKRASRALIIMILIEKPTNARNN